MRITITLITLLAWIASAGGAVFHSKESAFKAALPADAEVTQKTLYLSEADRAWIEAQSGPGFESRIRRVYVARRGGEVIAYAYFDTRAIRTLDQTLLFVLDAQGRLDKVLQVAFHEPDEYRAPAGWLRGLEGHGLTPKLSTRGAIDGISGATLTARATVSQARAILALHQRALGAR